MNMIKDQIEQMEAAVKQTDSEIKQLQEKLKARAIKLFQGAAKQFFNENPDVRSFSWRQYEPWNDGEETSFEVFRNADDLTVNGKFYYDVGASDEERDEQFEKVSHFLNKFSDELLEKSFGNGFAITVTPTGMDIESYNE